MAHMRFDLEDGGENVCFSLSETDSERFVKFMAECHAAMVDAERYRHLREEENWGEDSGDDAWAVLGESTGEVFDEVVDSRMQKHGQDDE